MSQRNDDFAQVLDRLRTVRQELTRTSNPDKVAGLRDLAQQLVRAGEELLGLLERPAAPAPPPAADQVTAFVQRPGAVLDASAARDSAASVGGGTRTPESVVEDPGGRGSDAR